jgi:predicted NUDIX family NTP pyrophosphohydrolase
MARAARLSAGLLAWRRQDGELQVLLGHPGGPFWAGRDSGAWTIPKGEIAPGEDPLAAAIREFEEEIGVRPDGPFTPLGEVTQKAGKRVMAWATLVEIDTSRTGSSTVTLEWPRGSGRTITFPEVDRSEWFGLDEARRRINSAQAELLDRLAALAG